MEESWIQLIASVLIALAASSGFWAVVQRKITYRDVTTRLLMGLAYDKITFLGMSYIDRGWISKDEYEDFRKYLYEPYVEFGGNGVAERVMNEVSRLPLTSSGLYADVMKVRTSTESQEMKVVKDEDKDG